MAAAIVRHRQNYLPKEDEAAMMVIIAEILQLQGYNILLENRPSEAFRLSRENTGSIDLLLTNVVEMTGRELATSLTVSYPQPKCLLVSGYIEDVMVDRRKWPEKKAHATGRIEMTAIPFFNWTGTHK